MNSFEVLPGLSKRFLFFFQEFTLEGVHRIALCSEEEMAVSLTENPYTRGTTFLSKKTTEEDIPSRLPGGFSLI